MEDPEADTSSGHLVAHLTAAAAMTIAVQQLLSGDGESGSSNPSLTGHYLPSIEGRGTFGFRAEPPMTSRPSVG
jgi:hypothetical protein